MAYCTRVDLEARFGTEVLADLEYGKPDAVDEAIADAASLIDSYIAARYALPLEIIPPVLTRTARDLVRYSLDNDPTEAVSKRRDDAIKFLEALTHGRATLGVPAAAEPQGSGIAEVHSDGRVFGRRNSKGFI